MFKGWDQEILSTAEEVFAKLIPLSKQSDKQSSFWVFRGSNRKHDTLFSSFDRLIGSTSLARKDYIHLERQSIDLFKNLFNKGTNENFNGLLQQNIPTLMFMQHYGAKTRLLDWSLNPFIAAFFAVSDKSLDNSDGQICCFEYQRYMEQGNQQWHSYPEMFDSNGRFLDYLFPSFQEIYAGEWIVCQFLYKYKFPRILTQNGLFTFTSQFKVDHAQKIKQFLDDPNYHKVYIIKSTAKKELRRRLIGDHGISHKYIFPQTPELIEIAINAVIADEFLIDSVKKRM